MVALCAAQLMLGDMSVARLSVKYCWIVFSISVYIMGSLSKEALSRHVEGFGLVHKSVSVICTSEWSDHELGTILTDSIEGKSDDCISRGSIREYVLWTW